MSSRYKYIPFDPAIHSNSKSEEDAPAAPAALHVHSHVHHHLHFHRPQERPENSRSRKDKPSQSAHAVHPPQLQRQLPEIIDNPEPQRMVVRLEPGLCYRYPGSSAGFTNGTLLEFHSGEYTLIIGPNGGGKSTLMRLLRGELAPTTGRVIVLGHDLAALNDSALAQLRAVHLPTVSSASDGLLNFANTFENMALRARLLGWPESRIRPMVESAMKALGLPMDCQARCPAELSSGNKARVLLARSMIPAANAGVYLCDEPESFADTAARTTLYTTLKNLANAGSAIIHVSHVLENVIPYADRVVAVKAGQVAWTQHRNQGFTTSEFSDQVKALYE